MLRHCLQSRGHHNHGCDHLCDHLKIQELWRQEPQEHQADQVVVVLQEHPERQVAVDTDYNQVVRQDNHLEVLQELLRMDNQEVRQDSQEVQHKDTLCLGRPCLPLAVGHTLVEGSHIHILEEDSHKVLVELQQVEGSHMDLEEDSHKDLEEDIHKDLDNLFHHQEHHSQQARSQQEVHSLCQDQVQQGQPRCPSPYHLFPFPVTLL